MKIAALDSSGLVASVAVLEDDILLAEYTVNHKKTHSQTLLPMLEEIKQMIELELGTLDAIAISAGPGSFTGLRIGSATAKGLAMALRIPIIPVPTIDALAYNMYGSNKLICPIMDARREQVYTGLYEYTSVKEDSSESGKVQAGQESMDEKAVSQGAEITYVQKRLLEQCAVSIEDLIAKINEVGREVVFLGDGVPVFNKKIGELLQVPYSYAPAHLNRQRAAAVGTLGMQLYAKGISESAEAHKPEYLRVSQAERERNETIVIRKLEEQDLEAVSKLEEENFSMPWSVNDFREMVEHPDALYLVAVDRGIVCATCGVRNIFGDGEITNVVVREEYRGSGLGQKIIKELLKQGSTMGITAFTLEVRKSNRTAIHVYEKLGFVSVGIRPRFYEKPEEDAVIMWRR